MPSVLRITGASRRRLGLVATLAVAAAALAAALLITRFAYSDPGDVVFSFSIHGDTTSGVSGEPTADVGACRNCHTARALPTATYTFGLFTDPNNGLCFACHSTVGTYGFFLGDLTYLGASHWASAAALWPGPDPAPRMMGEEGYCLNCHTPHGRSDAFGLIPELKTLREEALCLGCHNASGPASTDIDAQVMAADAHPVLALADVHTVAEGLSAAAFADGSRHAECVDCHNPHAAKGTSRLSGVSRLGVVNGGALTTPAFVPLPATDTTPVQEYEVCFKCHSSWTTLPAGARDLAFELNPNNASFHPVEASGTNTTSTMANSLAGGTGSPSLTTSSIITCSDCHGSDLIPTTVTTVSNYLGAIPTGPHGSDAATTTALSPAILRARYRTTPRPSGGGYNAADFELCFICHSSGPFGSTSSDSRTDTEFRFHGLHVRDASGGGFGDAICSECHYSLHGVGGAFWPSNAGYTRLVSFSPNVTGMGGAGSEPDWDDGARECTLMCHGKDHDPKDY